MEAEVTAAGAAPMAVEVVASTVEAVAVFTAVVAAPAAGVAPTVAAHLRRVPMPGGRQATTAATAAIPAAFRACRDSIAAAARWPEAGRERVPARAQRPEAERTPTGSGIHLQGRAAGQAQPARLGQRGPVPVRIAARATLPGRMEARQVRAPALAQAAPALPRAGDRLLPHERAARRAHAAPRFRRVTQSPIFKART